MTYSTIPASYAVQRRIRHGERGITLLESLLAVTIISMLFAVGTYVVTQYTRQVNHELSARLLLRVQTAGEEFAKTNLAQLLDGDTPGTDIETPGDVQVLTLGDLIAANFLRNIAIDPLGFTPRVYLRNASDPAPAPPTIEVITVTDPTASAPEGRALSRLIDVASYGRGRIGILSNGLPYDVNNFRSSSREWSFPRANIPAFVAPAPDDVVPTGYLASYSRLTSEDIFDPNVLFRMPVLGSPESNQMATTLNMNGRNIINVSTMTADRVTTAGMTLAPSATSPAPAYALSTEDVLTMNNTQTVNNMIVYGDNNAGTSDMTAFTASTGTGAIVASTLTTTDMVVGADGLVTRNATATNNTTVGEFIMNNSATINNQAITTTNLQLGTNPVPAAATLRANTVQSGAFVTGTVNTTGAFQANTGANHLVTNNVRVEGSANVGNVPNTDEAQFQDLCYTSPPTRGETNVPMCP